MFGLRSLRNRLAVVFGLIVLGAIGTIYLTVTPRLQERLRNQKLERLEADARTNVEGAGGFADTYLPGRGKKPPLKKRVVNQAAAGASAEVLILEVHEEPLSLVGKMDSVEDGGLDTADARDLGGFAAARTGRPVARTQVFGGSRYAIVAYPLIQERPADDGEMAKEVVGVAVFDDTLDEVEGNVALIRRQILLSGGIALVIALGAGYLVARALSQRVARLEQAARKVAAGDFSNPIRADSDDELGQLAAAFDDMQNQLARLDRARKQFIASASHELRTPIFSLGGFLELLADEDLDEETRRQFLDQLRGQVDRMRKLATELLDLSRLESGALELRPEPTDVGQLAREVAAEFTPAAQRHESIVVLELENDPIELDCDPERVAQVLRILLDNALVHTPAGTGVRVSADRRNGHVRLEVSDRGQGIKRQNMPHIFEPFFTSNEEAQGAGLGLAIARELAERMQGRLTVRSAPGSTTFSLVLPG
ncbi:MAG TPA: HAMP domain-containing sensor histidine kinase [Solirubrobacteraceae bacterium]|nr:HAMP domain-containing sensor histidine kinase [Solirubrobacteraceae bacterium]